MEISGRSCKGIERKTKERAGKTQKS